MARLGSSAALGAEQSDSGGQRATAYRVCASRQSPLMSRLTLSLMLRHHMCPRRCMSQARVVHQVHKTWGWRLTASSLQGHARHLATWPKAVNVKTPVAHSSMTTACFPRVTRSKLHIQPLKCISVILQEYEKRLLAKDHEVKAAQMQIEHLRSEVLEAKRVMAEGSNLLPAPEPTAGKHGAAWRHLQGWRVVMAGFVIAACV